MPINVGKNPGVVYSSNNDIISFYNAPITEQEANTLYFFKLSEETTPYFQITPSSYVGYRCLHYDMYSTLNVLQHQNHLVIYRNYTNEQVGFIYQTMNLTATKIDETYIISFWSVLKNGKTLKTKKSEVSFSPSLLGKVFKQNGEEYVYAYDDNKILKFKQQQLQDYQLQSQYKNIFCNIKIDFENYLVSTTSDVKNAIEQQVMMVNLPPQILCQKKDSYPVLDFAGIGGSGGGMRQHQHIPYVDGSGYAFAVFHPGTSMPQLPWKQI